MALKTIAICDECGKEVPLPMKQFYEMPTGWRTVEVKTERGEGALPHTRHVLVCEDHDTMKLEAQI